MPSQVTNAGSALLKRARRSAILAMLLVAGCAGPAHTPAVPPIGQGCDLSAETQELAAEFGRLRVVQGQFQGGLWTADVDEWMGRKHQAMIELGSRLGGGGCGQGQVTDLLGAPDRIAGPGDPLFALVSRLPEFERPPGEPYELLIYYWRAAHDFLYFTCQGETIVSWGWWYAYE